MTDYLYAAQERHGLYVAYDCANTPEDKASGRLAHVRGPCATGRFAPIASCRNFAEAKKCATECHETSGANPRPGWTLLGALVREELPQGYMVMPNDVGCMFDGPDGYMSRSQNEQGDQGFGAVRANDVGKRVYARNYVFSMENDEQRATREAGFRALVLNEVRLQRSYGARWPSPVTVLYQGELTAEATRLGFTSRDRYHAERGDVQIFRAVKRLREAGKLVFIQRHGHTWIVEPGSGYATSEVVDRPQSVDCPSGWEAL